MKSLMIRELKSNYKSLIFWSLGILFLVLIGFIEYGLLIENSADLAKMVDIMPRTVQIMMGMVLPIETEAGYFACMLLFICLGFFLYAAILGANIVSKEENDKTAEFIFSKPIKRNNIITSKLIIAKLNVIILGIIIWLSTYISFGKHIKKASLITDVNLCILGMIISGLVFLFIGFLCSAILKEKSKPLLYSATIVLITYFISIFVQVIEINHLRFLTPFLYFDPVNIINEGINILYILISIIISIICIIIGYKLWNQRDLRV